MFATVRGSEYVTRGKRWLLSPARLQVPLRRRVQEHRRFARRGEHFTESRPRTLGFFALLLEREDLDTVRPDDLTAHCTVTVTERVIRPYWLVA